MTSFLNPNLTYDRRAVAREARRIARRGAHLPLSAGAWQRIAWGKARDERNRTIAGWLALRLALALARGRQEAKPGRAAAFREARKGRR